jgi:ABC-2 type transport system ATP-binding protein
VATNGAAIDMANLTKHYPGGAEPAIDHLTMSVPKGQVFGILGPNGAGKTTTVAILCGLLSPTHGEVHINGHNLKLEPSAIRKVIGYVPQDIALYPSLTARENLQFFGNMYGLRGQLLRSRIDHYLNQFGLREHADKLVDQFSGGMKRRTNIIAGLLHQPKILFLDEPTVGIDVQSRSLILQLLEEINQQGTTIIYTSHHMEEAQQFCSGLAILDRGQIIKEGAPDTLVRENEASANLEDLFLNLTGRSLRD